MSTVEEGTYAFGQHTITAAQAFLWTPLSMAIVNRRPVVHGHVMVIPRRRVVRLCDMTADEVCDLWLAVQRVARTMEAYHGCDACTITLQDGPAAGQTVQHVHVHILPRFMDDLADNNDIYPLIDAAGPGELPAGFVSLNEQFRRSRALAVDVVPSSTSAEAGLPSSPAAGTAPASVEEPGSAVRGGTAEAPQRGRPKKIPVSEGNRSAEAMAAEAAVYRALF